jgi:hypothetical protein
MDYAGSVILHLSRCAVGTEIIAHWLVITGYAKPIVKVVQNVTYPPSYSESAKRGALIIEYIQVDQVQHTPH